MASVNSYQCSKKMVNDRCVVGCCDNDKRYPDRTIIHSNVASGKLVFHKIRVNDERRKAWMHAVSKGREAFDPPILLELFCSDISISFSSSSTLLHFPQKVKGFKCNNAGQTYILKKTSKFVLTFSQWSLLKGIY